MTDQDRGSSERGTIEPRRGGRQTFGNLWDWEPFRGFFPSTWQQAFGIDVRRRENGYEVEIPVPGFRPEDIDITYQDGIITVTGRNERRTFTRSLTVPEDVDEEGIEANVEHGILTLFMRQRPEKQPKRIAIKATTGEAGGQKAMTSGAGTPSSTTQQSQTAQSTPRR
jgi:HSP20 family protein